MYPGGKDGSGVWQRIVNELPPHDVFISAFLGDCAVLRRKQLATRNIGIDLDPAAVAAFSGRVPDALADRLELYEGDGVAWLWHAFDLGRRLPAWIPASEPGGRIEGRSAEVARFGVPAGRVVVYCDPPYVRSSRKGGGRLYRCEMSDADHARLLDVVKRLPCLCAVSHYPCQLYDDALIRWRRIEYEVPTRRGLARENLWLNFSPAETLHDARWLGTDKREREKFRRRRENLRRRLMELPALERQSLLLSLSDGVS